MEGKQHRPSTPKQPQSQFVTPRVVDKKIAHPLRALPVCGGRCERVCFLKHDKRIERGRSQRVHVLYAGTLSVCDRGTRRVWRTRDIERFPARAAGQRPGRLSAASCKGHMSYHNRLSFERGQRYCQGPLRQRRQSAVKTPSVSAYR
jgi:hypothetical protein